MRLSRMMGGRTVAAGLLLGVSACAAAKTAHQEEIGPPVSAPNAPATAQSPRSAEAALKAALETLMASQTAGQTAAVKGFGFLNIAPAPPVLLANGEISLIPSIPELEAALLEIGRKWRTGQRRPISEPEFREAVGLLDRHVHAVRALGGDAFIRFAETDDKGVFTFEGVPAGRWLLVTTMESPVSGLLWAIPGVLHAGETAQVVVGNGNILVEGQRSASREPTKP